jgi:hypothetical protein
VSDYKGGQSDASLLEEIRDRFDYATDEWREIRDQARIDMRYIGGDAWDPKDRAVREEAGRPCLNTDELEQHVNQLINDIRQNKRAIKVTPVGNGATSDTAELRASLIRQIEYRSNAQQVYTTMFENAVQRSYGYLRITPKYVSDEGFDQELRLEPVPNPDLVTPDPDFLKPDGADWKYLFYGERWPVAEFKKAFPHAEVRDFASAHHDLARNWVAADLRSVLVAEYWKVETRKRQLILLKPTDAQGQPTPVYADELKGLPPSDQILKMRAVDDSTVCQYLSNGLEILRKTGEPKFVWPGKSIPFVACYGKVLYLDDGQGTKRRIHSMIRKARDPQMLYSYIQTCKAETVGAVPRNSWIGYKGQFRGTEEQWQKANHVPVAYLEANAVTDDTGANVLPLPQRQPWDPPLQNLDIIGESARRAIQASIGSNPLPTQAQRRNEKSGVALRQIEDSAQKGSYHFVDHFEDAVTRTGAILDELIPHYYDTARDVTVRKPNDDAEVARVNDPEAPDGHKSLTDGDHDVTISTGPSYASEREEASQFATDLVGNPQLAQVIGPQKMTKLIALAIKLKAVGPTGDAMADVIDPPQQTDPAQQAQQAQQIAQENQELKAHLQQATQIIQTEQVKQQATIEKAKIDGQASIHLQRMKDATSITVAKINALTKGVVSANEAAIEAIALDHQATQNALDRAHDAGMAAEGHQQGLEAGAVGHQQALEQGEAGHGQSMEAQQAAADQAAQQQAEAGA